MSDIAKKLRNTLTSSDRARQTLNEAADEIERLRGLYEREHAYGHTQTQLLEATEARLAEAVEVVQDCHDVLHRLTAIIPGNDQALVETTAAMARARDFLAKMETKP